MSSPPRDTRKHDRASLQLPVVVKDSAHRATGGIRFAASDLSVGGAFLRSDYFLEVGELVELELELPGGRVIRGAGRVARVSRERGPDRSPGMGVDFSGFAPEDRRVIEQMIARGPTAS